MKYPREETITFTRGEIIELHWHLETSLGELFFHAEPHHYKGLMEKIDKAYENVTGLKE